MDARGVLARYLATATLTRIATEASGPAILVVSIAVLGGASEGPFLVAALTGAAAIAGPVTGSFLDRTSRPRPAFGWAMALFGVGLLSLGMLIGRAPMSVLVPVAVVTGAAYPALTGAWTAQIPMLLPKEQLPKAYSADIGTYSVASIIGGPLAAALLVVSDRAPLWLPAVILVIAALFLRAVPLRPRDNIVHVTLAISIRQGMGTIIKRVALRRAFIITTISFVGQAAIFVSAPLIAQERTGSLAMTGVILGAVALGGVLASLYLIRRPVRHPDRALVIATGVGGLGLLVTALAPNIALVLVGAFILGVSEAPQMSATFQVRNRESDPSVRAQVFTTAGSLRTTAFAVGSFLFGAIIASGPIVVNLVGSGIHFAAIALGIAFAPAARTMMRA